jgi:two-component system, OmpR family, phosphate regulon response regulator PhoB
MGRKVLLVEQDDSIAAALEFVITRDGLSCERLTSGAQALGRIRSLRPDLVLLDVMLPGVSGYDICRDLRGDPALARVRVLMMTARGSAAEQRRALDHGADGFISKPFEMAELKAQIARLMAC